MPRHKSPKRQLKKDAQRRLRNRISHTRIRNLAGKVETAVAEQRSTDAETWLREATAQIDKAWKRGQIHGNAAGRRKARLARLVHRLRTPAEPGNTAGS